MARIALDIDSTLHHYWDLLERVARDRYGLALPYEEQHDWGNTGLDRDQMIAVIEETHSDANIEAAVPYPGAVEAVQRWHEEGHWIHVTSHRREVCAAATERWLDRMGIPFDDLHCSFDKISRCVELDIDVLVDDSPVNIAAALANGMLAATLIHPWNKQVIEEEDAIAAGDWHGLAQKIDEALAVRASL